MAFTLLLLQSIWGIAFAFVTPFERKLVHIRPRPEDGECFGVRAIGTANGCVNAQHYLPSHSGTNFRLNAAANNEDETPKGVNITDINIIAIPEKIRWIFEEAEGDFLDDDDDSFFDDLFLTDDEDDEDNDSVDLLTDDNGDDEPDASLNEEDLMQLYDMYPGLHLASPPSTRTTVGANNSSILSLSTSVSTNETTKILKMATDIETEYKENSDSTSVSLDNILASLESDLSYFYLRDELGISEDVMWKITNEAPSVLGLKAKNVRNKVHVLQSLVGFTDAEIRQLITSQPTLLQLSVKKNLSPTILYWIRQLEMGKKDLKALILGCPTLLKYSRANIHLKLVFFQTTMGYSLSDCRKLLVKDPRLLTSSVKTGLIPRLNFLHKEVEISLPNIRKITLKNPKILLMSVEQNLTPKCVFYFIMTLQMESKDVGKMLLKYPQVLDYNLEHHVLPIHHYFLSLDFSTHEFSRILQRYPRLITYSLIRIKRRIGYLRFELSLEANAIRRILHQCPQIVSLGQENIERTVEFLLQAVAPGASLVGSNNGVVSGENRNKYYETTKDGDIGYVLGDEMVDTDDRDALSIVQILIAGLPTLLALSIDNNLEPKVDYLRERLGQEELSNALLRMPALLGYSLKNRIRSRLEKILKAEIPGGKVTVAITLKEDAFEKWLERQIQNRPKNLRLEIKKKHNTAARKRRMTQRTDSEKNPVGSSSVTTPIIDQLEENATGRTNTMSGNENLPEITEDDTDGGTNKGNSRVVEEGGKIIHWRR